MDILNEVYFGRKPIEPLQRQLSIIRKKFRNKNVTASSNLDPDVIKFNTLAKKIFGFHNFSLYIQPTHIPNAYTFPVDVFFNGKDKKRIYQSLSANPTGFKYEDFAGVSLVMAINVGLIDLNYDELSDESLMSIALHEIGHGFFEAVTSPDTAYNASRKLTKIMKEVQKLAFDKIKNGKSVSEAIVDKELSMFDGAFASIRNFIETHKIVRESMRDNMRSSRIDYTNEKFADTFAAIYGYGDALATFNLNMRTSITKFYGIQPKKMPRIVEVMKMYRMYMDDLVAYSLNMMDPHPNDIARVKVAADYIKRELAKESIDPSMKKELVQSLNNINELLENYINFPKDEDSIRIYRLYSIKLYKKCGGDLREQDTDNDALFNKIDSKYNHLINSNESFSELDDILDSIFDF